MELELQNTQETLVNKAQDFWLKKPRPILLSVLEVLGFFFNRGKKR